MSDIEFVEVGARDGLQNEKVIVSTEDKVELIRRSIAAGVKRVEIASFVNPRKVPQMADAESVVELLGKPDGITRIGLVLNERGADRAIACGVDELGAVAVATDDFGVRNQGHNSIESIDISKQIIAKGKAGGLSAQVTISVAFGCPFAGPVDPDHVVEIAKQLAVAAPREIALADTIGVATPIEVDNLVRKVRAEIGEIPVRVHFHNTRNTGIANVWAAINAGATIVDASVGGLGGCPFAPGAAGNVASEDVAYMLSRSDADLGLDLEKLVETANWLEGVMNKKMPSMLSRAGGFPK